MAGGSVPWRPGQGLHILHPLRGPAGGRPPHTQLHGDTPHRGHGWQACTPPQLQQSGCPGACSMFSQCTACACVCLCVCVCVCVCVWLFTFALLLPLVMVRACLVQLCASHVHHIVHYICSVFCHAWVADTSQVSTHARRRASETLSHFRPGQLLHSKTLQRARLCGSCSSERLRLPP